MGACPFCRGEVNAELLQNGGHCPHCLIEIPGEDTPTDPGEAAKALQQAEAEAAKRGRKGWMMGLGAALLLGVGAGAWYGISQQEAEPLRVEVDWDYAPMSAHKDLADPTAAPPEEPAPETARAERSRRRDRQADGAAMASNPPPTGGQLSPTGNPGTNQASTRPSIGNPPPEVDPLDAIGQIGPRDRSIQAPVLSDPKEVAEHVRGVIKVNMKQLHRCYDQRLLENEGLKGTWDVSFSIGKDGKPANIRARGDGVSDAPLETCLARTIQGWSFYRMATPQPIDMPLRFGG